MTKVDLDQVANSREQVLFVIVALVLIILFFRVIYGGQTKQLDLFKTRLEALQMEKEALTKFLSYTPELEKGEFLSSKKGVKVKIVMGEIRSGYKDISALLNALTDPNFLKGVIIENLSYLPPMQDQGFARTDFTLNIRGSFMEILQYVERLEQFPAVFSVDNVSLKVAEGQPQDVESEILGHFYQMGSESLPSTALSVGGHP